MIEPRKRSSPFNRPINPLLVNARQSLSMNRLRVKSNNYNISIFDEIKRATPVDSNERVIAHGQADRKTMANRCIRSVVVTLARHEN